MRCRDAGPRGLISSLPGGGHRWGRQEALVSVVIITKRAENCPETISSQDRAASVPGPGMGSPHSARAPWVPGATSGSPGEGLSRRHKTRHTSWAHPCPHRSRQKARTLGPSADPALGRDLGAGDPEPLGRPREAGPETERPADAGPPDSGAGLCPPAAPTALPVLLSPPGSTDRTWPRAALGAAPPPPHPPPGPPGC